MSGKVWIKKHRGTKQTALEIKEDIELKLAQILQKLKEEGATYDPKMLPNYIRSVENHIKPMWEKAIFPQLLLYGNLIFGKIPSKKPQWLYLDA